MARGEGVAREGEREGERRSDAFRSIATALVSALRSDRSNPAPEAENLHDT